MGQVCPGGVLYGPGHLSQALSGHKEKVVGSMLSPSLLQATFSQPARWPLASLVSVPCLGLAPCGSPPGSLACALPLQLP